MHRLSARDWIMPALRPNVLRNALIGRSGEVVGYRSHAKRVVVAYPLRGEYTEHRNGVPEIVRKPGEQWVEGTDVAHWSENRGAEIAVLINVELFRAR